MKINFNVQLNQKPINSKYILFVVKSNKHINIGDKKNF